MQNREKTIEELNDILAKNYDALQGYRKAAERTKDNYLMGYFNNRAIERQEFIDELRTEVRSLGGEPTDDGTFQGSAHRVWINFKSALSFDDDEAILEECIRGEKNAIEEYDDLLEETHVPHSTRSLLHRQKTKIQEVLREIKMKEEVLD